MIKNLSVTASFILYLLICELLSIYVDVVDYPTYKAKTSFIYLSYFKELNPSKYLKTYGKCHYTYNTNKSQ